MLYDTDYEVRILEDEKKKERFEGERIEVGDARSVGQLIMNPALT